MAEERTSLAASGANGQTVNSAAGPADDVEMVEVRAGNDAGGGEAGASAKPAANGRGSESAVERNHPMAAPAEGGPGAAISVGGGGTARENGAATHDGQAPTGDCEGGVPMQVDGVQCDTADAGASGRGLGSDNLCWSSRAIWEAAECRRLSESNGRDAGWDSWLGQRNVNGGLAEYFESAAKRDGDQGAPSSYPGIGNGDAGQMMMARAMLYESEVRRLRLYGLEKERMVVEQLRRAEEEHQARVRSAANAAAANAVPTSSKAAAAKAAASAGAASARRDDKSHLHSLVRSLSGYHYRNKADQLDEEIRREKERISGTGMPGGGPSGDAGLPPPDGVMMMGVQIEAGIGSVEDAMREDAVYYPFDITRADLTSLQANGDFERRYVSRIEMHETESSKPKAQRGARELSSLLTDAGKGGISGGGRQNNRVAGGLQNGISERSSKHHSRGSQAPYNKDLAKKMQKIMADVIKALSEQGEASQPFLTKVPRNSKFAPGYYTIIKEPMDLGTMANRITKNKYTSKELFVYDLNLIFNNCRRYNGESTIYYQYANQLEEISEKEVAAVPDFDIFKDAAKPAEKGKPLKGVLLDSGGGAGGADADGAGEGATAEAATAGSGEWSNVRVACSLRAVVPNTDGSENCDQGAIVKLELVLHERAPEYDGYECERRWRQNTMDLRMEREAMRMHSKSRPFSEQRACIRTSDGMACYTQAASICEQYSQRERDGNGPGEDQALSKSEPVSIPPFHPEYSFQSNAVPRCPPILPQSIWSQAAARVDGWPKLTGAIASRGGSADPGLARTPSTTAGAIDTAAPTAPASSAAAGREENAIQESAACRNALLETLLQHLKKSGIDHAQESSMFALVEVLEKRLQHFGKLAVELEETEGRQLTSQGRGQLAIFAAQSFGDMKPSVTQLKQYINTLKRREKHMQTGQGAGTASAAAAGSNAMHAAGGVAAGAVGKAVAAAAAVSAKPTATKMRINAAATTTAAGYPSNVSAGAKDAVQANPNAAAAAAVAASRQDASVPNVTGAKRKATDFIGAGPVEAMGLASLGSKGTGFIPDGGVPPAKKANNDAVAGAP